MIKKIDKKAFTLIEVLVVVAIIGILALLAFPRFIGHTQKAELVRIQHDVKAMEKEIGTKLINKDDEFNKWENNIKDLNQLVKENKLFEKEGVAKEVDSTDGTYRVIPKEYKAKINTKLKGTFYANSGGKVYYEPGEMPGNSDEETKDTINPDDDKWVENGNWGINGKWVVDNDGNAVIYAIDASKPIVFHNMYDENAKLPANKLTTLTFQDKVQGDTNSSMKNAFFYTSSYISPNFKTINNLDTNVDTSNVISMAGMFQSSQLTSVDLSKWNTSNVTNMNNIFSYSKLTSVGDLSQWNTSNVKDMNYMFRRSQLTSVGDLGKWNTSNVNYMYSIFSESNLTSVGDLSQWNTSNVTYMGWMFSQSKLTSVGDLGKWNTSKVTDMKYMFYKSQLTSVGDLGKWNTSNVYPWEMSGMFQDSKLTPPAWYH